MKFAHTAAQAIDRTMCAMMYLRQRRHRLGPSSASALESYIREHEALERNAYFAAPALPPMQSSDSAYRWPSPVVSGFAENDRAYADLYPCARGWSAPTVLLLHALMSTSDIGYRRWAAAFNARGWNAVFMHLPYHYSRVPYGYWNGELAITPDLVRTAEGLRQGVAELRQLMGLLRAWGCREFGVWASSYGGWIGGLLASVEADFRFVALMEPIVDVEHAIWISPAGLSLRREFLRHGIEQQLIERHFRLTSPLRGAPLCGGERVLLALGDYDCVVPPECIEALHTRWPGSELLRIPQGHFGYRMMPAVWQRLIDRGWLA